jgi:hypothetical protein
VVQTGGHRPSPILSNLAPPAAGREVAIVKLRVALVVVATALIALVTGAVVAAIVSPDPTHHLASVVRAAPLPPVSCSSPARAP